MSSNPPKYTNRLAGETSPYLLQHAHNPVDWRPWGEDALKESRDQQKPIFLSIGYAACHWCHVMERESFENEVIAAVINENFIPIKVDREERPDLDDVYMTATQLMTGSGGWPMSVFLTPELKPFYAGTYFPPDDGMFNRPGFGTLCRELGRAWRERRDEVERVAEDRTEAVRASLSGQLPEGDSSAALDDHFLIRATDQLIRDFDSRDGGFGGAPKFPPAMRLATLLRIWERAPGDRLRTVIDTTLDRMARGGMYDQVGGGFHRYSVDERWLVPHFEKMLYDNALLAWVYLEAGTTLSDPACDRVARQILDDVRRGFVHPEGGVYSTLDADSEGEEGKYYVWSPDEVMGVLGKEDGEFFCRVFDITERGNFEGKNIPNLLPRGLPEWAETLGVPLADLYIRVDGMRERLRVAREKRIPPGLDDKILSSWNGLMIRAFALGAQRLGDAAYLEAAERAADFVLNRMRGDGRLLRTFRAGQARLNGYLDDYAFMGVGLLALHSATGAARWLDAAAELLDDLDRWFWDEASGVYYFTAHDHEELIARIRDSYDNAIPSGNAMAALAHAQIAAKTGDPKRADRCRRILGALWTTIIRMPAGFPTLLLAADTLLVSETAGAISSEGWQPGVEVHPLGTPWRIAVGSEAEFQVQVSVPSGWHLYEALRCPEGMVGAHLDVATADGFGQVSVGYPPVLSRPYGPDGTTVQVYEGDFVLRVRLQPSASLPTGEYPLRLSFRYQACTDRECQLPAIASLETILGVT